MKRREEAKREGNRALPQEKAEKKYILWFWDRFWVILAILGTRHNVVLTGSALVWKRTHLKAELGSVPGNGHSRCKLRWWRQLQTFRKARAEHGWSKKIYSLYRDEEKRHTGNDCKVCRSQNISPSRTGIILAQFSWAHFLVRPI